MAHGTKDWAEMAPRTTVYTGIDLTELAARLSSIVTFDRRGDVIFLDSFESGRQAWRFGCPIGFDCYKINAERARSGGFSLELISQAEADSTANAYYEGFRPVVSKIGVEVGFSFDALVHQFTIRYYDYDGTTSYRWAIRYDHTVQELQIRDGVAGWVPLETSFRLYLAANYFHIAKLVFDLDTKKYVRLLLDSDVWDLSAYTARSLASGLRPMGRLQLLNEGDEDNETSTYVDDVIITQNEP